MPLHYSFNYSMVCRILKPNLVFYLQAEINEAIILMSHSFPVLILQHETFELDPGLASKICTMLYLNMSH